MNRETAYLHTTDSPAGAFTFAADGSGAVLYSRFEEGNYREDMEEELLERGYAIAEDAAVTEYVADQVAQYSEGRRRDFDLVVAPVGTAWRLEVWDALTRIPFGETRTYSQLAAMAGRPGSARAAGRANGTNRLPLFVPCHRVIGSDGSLTGFAGGIHLKERLLDHERTVAGEGASL